LNCKMILKWFDHDGHEHNDKGYMMSDSTPPIYKAGYGFSFIGRRARLLARTP